MIKSLKRIYQHYLTKASFCILFGAFLIVVSINMQLKHVQKDVNAKSSTEAKFTSETSQSGQISTLADSTLAKKTESSPTSKPSASDHASESADYFSFEVITSLIAHIGIAFLLIGLVSIIVEMDHWVHYFQKRVADVIIENEHLESLSQDGLIQIQTSVLKAYFKNNDIAGIDGFLQYYQNHIQYLIGAPFRVNVDCIFLIQYYDSSKEHFRVTETLSWECKRNKTAIQEFIDYQPEPDEFEELKIKKLEFSHEKIENGSIEIKEEDIKKTFSTQHGGMRFPILPTWKEMDGLKVKIETEYKISIHKFLAWRMAAPSRGVSMIVNYPTDFDFRKESYVMESYGKNYNNTFDKTDLVHDGFVRFATSGWVLPNEGITFQLVRKKPLAASVPPPSTAAVAEH